MAEFACGGIVTPGVDILPDHPSEGVEDSHLLQPQRRDFIQYLFQGFFDADHGTRTPDPFVSR